MLIRKNRVRDDLPQRIYLINKATIDNIERISKRLEIPKDIIITACEKTGRFFWQTNTAKPMRRILNQLKIKQKIPCPPAQTVEYIGKLAFELKVHSETLFLICDETGLFPIKVPSKTISTF